MTPDQIQSEIDGLNADAGRCDQDGLRRAASSLRGAARRLRSYLPAKAPEPSVQAAKAPEPTPPPDEVPKGTSEPGAVDRGGKPFADRKPKG